MTIARESISSPLASRSGCWLALLCGASSFGLVGCFLMRPIYETENDRQKEAQVARWYAKRTGGEPIKLPPLYPVDWAIADHSGVFREWIEIKNRTIRHDQFETYMLSFHKAEAMINISAASGLAALLIVNWIDAVGIMPIVPGWAEIRIGGRADRGDQKDIEPVCHIPIRHFQVIGKEKR